MSNTTLVVIIIVIIIAVIIFFFWRSNKEKYTGNLSSRITAWVVNKAIGYGGKKYNISIRVKYYPGDESEFDEPEITIPYGKSENIRRLKYISDIETSGDYARGWISNAAIIDKIKQEAVDLQYNIDERLYLHVVSNGTTGYYINGWHWAERSPGNFPNDNSSSNNSNILIEYTTIDDITSGALGNDYGKKVRDICNADYTVAQASGYANLCTDFGKRLKTDVLRGAPSSIKTREEAIKNIIDGLYAKYNMYRTPVGPRKICFITPCKGMFE